MGAVRSITSSAIRFAPSTPWPSMRPSSQNSSARGSVDLGIRGRLLVDVFGVVVAACFAKVFSLSGYSGDCCASASSRFAAAIRWLSIHEWADIRLAVAAWRISFASATSIRKLGVTKPLRFLEYLSGRPAPGRTDFLVAMIHEYSAMMKLCKRKLLSVSLFHI